MPINDKPTSTRYTTAAWLCGLTGLLYLDRICMSQAAVPLQEELGLSNTEMSLVHMSFTLTYGIFAVPAGWWGDRKGPRLALAQMVFCWSLFTACTGMAGELTTLLIARMLFGIAEAGALPNLAKVIVRWFPTTEQGRVQGLTLAFSQFGAILAPAATAAIIGFVGWRPVFFSYGLLGFAWAVGFWFWFRDHPGEHAGVNAAERELIASATSPAATVTTPVPWKQVAVNRGIILLCIIMILAAFYTYFFYSWFQKYLKEARDVENLEAGSMASVIMLGSAIGILFGGWVSDRLIHWISDVVRARRYLGVGCFLSAATCSFLAIRCTDPWLMSGLLSLAFLTMHITIPSWWACAIPQSGKHTATLCGLMNGMGTFGAMTSQGFVGWFADRQEQIYHLSGRAAWDPLFDVYVCVLLAGAVAWWCFQLRPLTAELPPQQEV